MSCELLTDHSVIDMSSVHFLVRCVFDCHATTQPVRSVVVLSCCAWLLAFGCATATALLCSALLCSAGLVWWAVDSCVCSVVRSFDSIIH